MGYLLAYHAADEAEIARIAVQKEARRQGAAGKLMQALEHYCEEHKMEKLLLDVRESNEAARSFYTKTDSWRMAFDRDFMLTRLKMRFDEQTARCRCLMDFKRMLIESLEVPEAVPSRNCGDIRL